MSGSEADVRRSLGYAPWSCNLCPERFHSEEEARIHFAPTVSDHPGQPFSVSEAIDVHMELRVRDASRMAQGAHNQTSGQLAVSQTRSQEVLKGASSADSQPTVPSFAKPNPSSVDTRTQMSSEGDIRRSLSYAPWSCNICSEKFYSQEEARIHFSPTVSEHPGQDFSVSEAIDVQMEMRVRDALMTAGGSQKIQQPQHQGLPAPFTPAAVMSVASEADVRRSLGYAPWSCNLCPEKFFSDEEARIHFAPVVSAHPGQDFSVSEAMDIPMEMSVHDAMMRGGGQGPGPQSHPQLGSSAQAGVQAGGWQASSILESADSPKPMALGYPQEQFHRAPTELVPPTEADLRRQLNYAPWSCNFCTERFFSEEEASIHFNPMVSSHPGQPLSVSESMDIPMEMKVREAMRRGGGQGPTASQSGGVALPGAQAGGWQAMMPPGLADPSASMAPGQPQEPFDRAPTALAAPNEADIRRQLGYAPWSCNLCPEIFYSDEEAAIHFNPMVSSHPGQPLSISEAMDIPMEVKVREAMKRALGSASAHGNLEPQGECEAEGDEAAAASGASVNVCAQCSQRVGATRKAANDHVRQRHLSVPPYACKLCDHTPPGPAKAKLHAVNIHAVELNWERSWVTSLVDVDELAREFSRCFPGLKPLDQAASRAYALAKERAGGFSGPREAGEEAMVEGCADQPSTSTAKLAAGSSSLIACRQCGRTVKNATDPRRNHVQMHHARLQRFQCRHCHFKQVHSGQAKSHAMAAHGATEEGWAAAFVLNPRDPDETRRLLQLCF